MKKQARSIPKIYSDDYGKILPHAIEVEETVIGEILLEPNAIFKVLDILSSNSFYKEVHQKIFKAAIELVELNLPIDILNVSNRLKKKNELDIVGGPYYVSQLTSRVSSALNIQYHALIIHQEYLKRLAIQKANEICTIAFDQTKDLEDISFLITELYENFSNEVSKTSGNLLDDARIRLDDKIEIEPHFLSIRNNNRLIGVMSKNNISAIIGKAKSRKSFAATLFSALIVSESTYELIKTKKQKVFYFDTEQARYHSQKIIFRVCEIGKFKMQPENFEIFNIKSLNVENRKKVIEDCVRNYRPDVIFIDGIRDLVLDFNDLVESSNIMNWLLMLIDEYNCHISLVIHINKADSNPRGHLGSEITNKCESVILVSIHDTDKSKSIISAVQTRGESFEPFGMSINEGIPCITGVEETFEDKIKKRKTDDLPF